MPHRGTVFLGVLVVMLGGCGSNGNGRAVLYEGQSDRSGHARKVSDAMAKMAVQRDLADWKRLLVERARLAPAQRFDNPTAAALRRRLNQDARRYDFRIVSLKLLHPRQVAPEIVVRTSHYTALARATGGILDGIDPAGRTAARPSRTRYEGLYFEAQDERGVPFLATYDFIRGRGPGGGQWARSEALYPFAHG